jgi:hypothetical protein
MAPPSISQEEMEDMRKELAAFGFSDSEIHQQLEDEMSKQPTIELLAECVEVFNWFTQVDDLFRFQGQVCMGLDVTAIKDDAQMRSLKVNPEHYKLLRVMGRAASSALNKRLSTKD